MTSGSWYSAPIKAGEAYTIYGGSQEIQNNIISKRILGLPPQEIGGAGIVTIRGRRTDL